MSALIKMATTQKSKKSEGYSVSSIYSIEGSNLNRKTNFCPKCGPGVFLAKHKDRLNCGKCGYTQFIRE